MSGIETKEDLIEAVESLQGTTDEIDDLKATVENLKENAVTDVPDVPEDTLTVDDLRHLAHDDCETEACNQIREEFGWVAEDEEPEDEGTEAEQGPEHPEDDDDETEQEQEADDETGSADDDSGGESGEDVDSSEPEGDDSDDEPGPIFG